MEEGRYLIVNTRGVIRSQLNIYDGVFCEISQQLLAVNCFPKKAPS